MQKVKKWTEWKVMFQNDKAAIYDFIFIDHIVFIFMGRKVGRLAEADLLFFRLTSLSHLKVH